MQPGALQWAHPWAWALVVVPLGLAAWRRLRGQHAARAYAEPGMAAWALRPSSPRRLGAAILADGLLWLLLAAALAGPRLPLARGDAAPPARHATALLVLWQLPAQGGAAGVSQARLALLDLQRRLHGEHLGLLVYDRASGLLLPCTADASLFASALRQATPRLLRGLRGPGLPGALALARRELLSEPAPSRAVLLVTGQAAPAEPELLRQARQLAASQIPVYLAWSGTGRPGAGLRALVSLGAGARADLAQPGLWSTLYEHGIERLPGGAMQAAGTAGWHELYAAPLLAALLLLLVSRGAAGGPLPGGAALLLTVAVGAGLQPRPAHAAQPQARPAAWLAWQAWSRHDDAACASAYARLRGFDARLGEGACAYRAGRFNAARAAFRRAMFDAPTDRERALALYDLGNASFHVPGGLREALDAYRASLALLPARPQTLHNLRLARARWAQQHPEAELAAMRKRGAPAARDFGDTSDTAPSQPGAARHSRRQRAWQDVEQRLRPGGRLRGPAAPAGRASEGLRVTAADARAAGRGMQLLHDHRRRLLRGLIEQDSRDAAELVGAPR